MNTVIKDIVEYPMPSILRIIEKEIQTLDKQNLHNAKNYKKMLTEIGDYDCFHVMLEDDTLIAFSGLYSKRWGNVGRALQCTYKNPKYRRKGLGYDSSIDGMQHLWSSTFIPLQMKVAKKRKLDAVIVSTEFPRRWYSLKKFTERLDGSFKLLPDMYFTCPRKFQSAVHKYCWQNITLCTLNDNYIFNFESITHKEWKECFEN
jgi:hypothetical protein